MDRLEWQINKSFKQNEEINKLKEENNKLRRALEVYAKPEHEYHVKSYNETTKMYLMKTIIEKSKLAISALRLT